MKIVTWNIGSFFFFKYAKYFGIKYKDQNITHEYFQPFLNGEFISREITKINPDIIFFQEIYDSNDIRYINFLKEYPYQTFINTWYHKHSILVASKYNFSISDHDAFTVVSCNGISFIPIHLNSFSASKRLSDTIILNSIQKQFQKVVILGDSNIWSRGDSFVFKNDKRAYKTLSSCLIDFSKDIISTSYLGFGLDKIFGSYNIVIKQIESPRIRGHFMDHYPVILELE